MARLNGKEGVASRSARQALPSKCLPKLLLLLGVAATAMWLACHGAEATEDPYGGTEMSGGGGGKEETAPGAEGLQSGYELPPSALEEVTYPPEYEGTWLIVKIERPGKRRSTKKNTTKPRRVKKMGGPKLNVFELKCFALQKPPKKKEFPRSNTEEEDENDFEKKMNDCHQTMMNFKAAPGHTNVRFTYVLPEKYKHWISTHFRSAFKNSQEPPPDGYVTVFYNCQLPGDEEAERVMCHRRGNGEFHPRVAQQYEINTLRVQFAGKQELPKEGLARTNGNVVVSASKDTSMRIAFALGDGKEKPLTRSDDGPQAIRTRGLSRPELHLSEGWTAMAGDVELVAAQQGGFDFWVQQVGQGTPSARYRVPSETKLLFALPMMPEIYVHPPTVVAKDSGRSEDNQSGLPIEIHIRLQKKSIVGSSWKKELGSDAVVFSCGTSSHAVAKCLESNSKVWSGREIKKVFLSSGNLKQLRTFFSEIAGEKQRKAFLNLTLPSAQDWTYVLEGGLTGKNKFFQKRVEKPDGAEFEEEVREMVMSGVTNSPVLKTKFSVPLNGSYARVRAAIPEITTRAERGVTASCPGGLHVTFDPKIRHVYYQTETTDDWQQLIYRSKSKGKVAPVEMKIDVMERHIYYKDTKQQQDIPLELTKIKIERSNDSDKGPLFKKIRCSGQPKSLNKELKKSHSAIVKWEEQLNLFSPRVVDDVSAKKGVMKKIKK